MESGIRLSKQQRTILLWLLQQMRTQESRNDGLGKIALEAGIEWRPHASNKERENSWRASLCRTVERLEHRGLIERVYGPKHRRTRALKLTDEGRRVAEVLSG